MHRIDHHIYSIRIALELLPSLGYALTDELRAYFDLDTHERSQALNLHQALSFYRTIRRCYPTPLVALDIGAAIPAQAFGMFGFAQMCSESLRATLEFAVRFQRLTYTLMTLAPRYERGTAALCFEPTNIHIDPELAIFFADRDLACSATMFAAPNPGTVRPKRVTLTHDGFGMADAYRAHFPCEVEFGASVSSLVFDEADIDKPSPYRNEQVHTICRRECERQLAEISRGPDIVDQVREELMSRPGYLQDAESVARELHLSTRTLRRRLAESGTSFQALQQEVRYEQAREYLSRPSLSVTEVADILGFSEPGNFSQAFKRWSGGLSPRGFRRLERERLLPS